MSENKNDPVKVSLAPFSHRFLFIALFSFVLNMLMLVVPLYMLQVYDRVLNSGSMETLAAISILAAGLLILLGLFDWLRHRIMVRTGNSFDKKYGEAFFNASFATELRPQQPGNQHRGHFQILIASDVILPARNHLGFLICRGSSFTSWRSIFFTLGWAWSGSLVWLFCSSSPS